MFSKTICYFSTLTAIIPKVTKSKVVLKLNNVLSEVDRADEIYRGVIIIFCHCEIDNII